jgi:hypothetical protein
MSKIKKRLAASAVGLLITTVAAIGAISLSGAAAPAQGASGPYAVAVSPFTANTPYASGQMINVVVPANSLFIPTSGVNILECSAPDGVLPSLPQNCDGNTIQTSTILPASDGSINLQTQGDGLYEVFALPDSISLGEGPSNEVTCGDTAATECVLYIGNNQGDFSQPHVFSQPFYVSANATDSGTPAGDGSAPSTTTPASTTLSTSLSGGGQSGTSISVPTGTAVTDAATLSGTNAATATGTVTYNVYTDSGCTTLASGGGGTALTITTPGSLPPSAPVTLSTAGTYYWGVSYSGDSSNQSSSSTCGTAGEAETVTASTTTPASTRLRTRLVGNGTTSRHGFRWVGGFVAVVAGTSVTDTATLRGTNAATATGTVTYNVYTEQAATKNHHRSWHWVAVTTANAGTVTVTAGQVPTSNAVTLPAGVYEWQAAYSGDAANQASASRFGTETEIVIPKSECGNGQRISKSSCWNDATRLGRTARQGLHLS